MLTSRATGDRENIEMQQPCEDPGTLAWDLDMANDKGALSRLPPCQCSSRLARG